MQKPMKIKHLTNILLVVMFDHGNGSPFVWQKFYTVTPPILHSNTSSFFSYQNQILVNALTSSIFAI